MMILASPGFSIRKSFSASLITSLTTGPISLETSLSLVWLENFGSGSFTDSTQVRPSRMSSPLVSTLAFLAASDSSM
ncbi:hypothetical protein D3C78_1356550 [compost metagenome]